jgi:uncharacterized protein YydD (DUF2326 family)
LTGKGKRTNHSTITIDPELLAEARRVPGFKLSIEVDRMLQDFVERNISLRGIEGRIRLLNAELVRDRVMIERYQGLLKEVQNEVIDKLEEIERLEREIPGAAQREDLERLAGISTKEQLEAKVRQYFEADPKITVGELNEELKGEFFDRIFAEDGVMMYDEIERIIARLTGIEEDGKVEFLT